MLSNNSSVFVFDFVRQIVKLFVCFILQYCNFDPLGNYHNIISASKSLKIIYNNKQTINIDIFNVLE